MLDVRKRWYEIQYYDQFGCLRTIQSRDGQTLLDFAVKSGISAIASAMVDERLRQALEGNPLKISGVFTCKKFEENGNEYGVMHVSLDDLLQRPGRHTPTWLTELFEEKTEK